MSGRQALDHRLLALVIVALLFGLVLVYSSSCALSAKHFGSSTYLLRKQLIAAALGLGVLLLLARLDYHRLQRWDDLLLLLAFGLTLLTAFPGLGRGGRWLRLGPFLFQPSELLKLALIIYTAAAIVRRGPRIRNFTEGVLPHLIVLALAALLVLRQPDFGMALIYGFIVYGLLFLGGARVKHLLGTVLAALPLLYLLLRGSSYRWERIIAFLDPFEHSATGGYQTVQSLIAVGSGGLLGRGLGMGREKLLYLPSAHNDFIFAVIGEELGLLGGLFVLTVFTLFVLYGMRIALSAPDEFGRLLGAGITLTIGLQAALNLGVTVGLLPVTGLTLPFISYGGSSLIVSLGMVGVLLNIARQVEGKGKEFESEGLGSWRGERWPSLPRAGDHGGVALPWRGPHRLRWG